MRTANNPLKSATLPAPARVVVLVITHLPEMESAYHRGRFEVIKRSLDTLEDNAIGLDYKLIIWDNGSCVQVKEWAQYVSAPHTLILSKNIGKTNALKSVMRMLPAGSILAYGDDDIEYMPNWLAPQIEILETFPNVGTVTGWPVRITGGWGVDSTLKRAKAKYSPSQTCDIEQGRFIPDEWERDYCESVGWNWESYKTQTWGVEDFRITYRGVQAYAMSQHCQFVCYPERVEPLIPWTDRAMADESKFDKAVDAAGLLRLATVERYTRHMGNALEERV